MKITNEDIDKQNNNNTQDKIIRIEKKREQNKDKSIDIHQGRVLYFNVTIT
jgi:hypothetical protein